MQNAVIFDMDGCLCDSSARVAKHITPAREAGTKIDWPAFFAGSFRDKPNEHVVDMARMIYYAGYKLVICTGRPETYREDSARWLNVHLRLPAPLLLMRAINDFRNDDLIKTDFVHDLRGADLNPVMAFDDRARILNAYRKLGIQTFGTDAADF